MTALTTEAFEDILNEAGQFDENIDRAWVLLIEDAEYQLLQKFFDADNFSRYDADYDTFIERDTAKIHKKLLRGQDVAELIKYALDLGRLIGRAEYTLLNHD